MLDLTPLRGLQISPAQLTGHASPRLDSLCFGVTLFQCFVERGSLGWWFLLIGGGSRPGATLSHGGAPPRSQGR